LGVGQVNNSIIQDAFLLLSICGRGRPRSAKPPSSRFVRRSSSGRRGGALFTGMFKRRADVEDGPVQEGGLAAAIGLIDPD
jgi:hypothetical protein